MVGSAVDASKQLTTNMRTIRFVNRTLRILCFHSANVVVEPLPSRAGACSCVLVSIEGSVGLLVCGVRACVCVGQTHTQTHSRTRTHKRHVRRTRWHLSNANTNIVRNQIQLLSITQGCYAIINVKWKSSSACAYITIHTCSANRARAHDRALLHVRPHGSMAS